MSISLPNSFPFGYSKESLDIIRSSSDCDHSYAEFKDVYYIVLYINPEADLNVSLYNMVLIIELQFDEVCMSNMKYITKIK